MSSPLSQAEYASNIYNAEILINVKLQVTYFCYSFYLKYGLLKAG